MDYSLYVFFCTRSGLSSYGSGHHLDGLKAKANWPIPATSSKSGRADTGKKRTCWQPFLASEFVEIRSNWIDIYLCLRINEQGSLSGGWWEEKNNSRRRSPNERELHRVHLSEEKITDERYMSGRPELNGKIVFVEACRKWIQCWKPERFWRTTFTPWQRASGLVVWPLW